MSVINRYIVCLMTSLFALTALNAQVFEQFNQNIDQLQNKWNCSDSSFWVNPKKQLQSHVSAKNRSEIYANLLLKQVGYNIMWSSYIAFDFNPSAQNQVRFYLYADSMNFTKSNHSLFLQFGGINGTDDAIELVQQSGTSKQILASSLTGFLKQNSSHFNFKCLIDSIGLLSFEIDTTMNHSFIQLFQIAAPSMPKEFYTGYWFKFTSSHVSSFIADNFYMGPIENSKQELKLIESALLNDSVCKFTWNRPIDTSFFESKISSNSKLLYSFIFNDSNSSFEIRFHGNFRQISDFEFCFQNIYSKEGLSLADTCLHWVFYNPKTADIRFSELMVDPEPIIGLPNAEFIELYNSTNYSLNLEGMWVSDTQNKAVLESYVLKPNKFVVLCATKDTALFQSFPYLAVQALPSLNNDSDSLYLMGTHAEVIDQVAYNSSWYHLNPLPSGGRSLCLINVSSDCPAIENWQASTDSLGGSPGFAGSSWNLIKDSLHLSLVHFTAINSTQFLAVFNKRVQFIQFFAKGFQIVPFWQSNTQDSFIFLFAPMQNKQEIQIQINNTCACNHNCMDTFFVYTYVPIQAALYNQLRFSELLFEPVTGTGISAFVELYNASLNRINLKDYQLCNGLNCIALPAYELYPDSFVAISKNELRGVKKQVILPKFFSLNLTDTLLIRSKSNQLIAYLPYSQNFYHDLYKQNQKSWSVECVNLQMPCLGEMNWHVCVNPNKHTAGEPNSIVVSTIDTVAPQLLSLYIQDEHHLVLQFNEAIDSTDIGINKCLQLNAHQLQWQFDNSPYSLMLTLEPALIKGEKYLIQLQSVSDCNGNKMPVQWLPLSLPEPIDSGNLLINEVLFDPVSDADDFIELYNNSEHFIDLKGLYFAFSPSAHSALTATLTFAPYGYLLAPNDYVIVSKSDQSVYFKQVNIRKQVLVNLPNLPNEGGFLQLYQPNQILLDAMTYSPSMHFKLLPSIEGVSLERLSFQVPSSFADNWHSASAQFQYATPTQTNSMQLKIEAATNELRIEPAVFSPDADAFNDLLQIHYRISQLTNFTSLNIYNLQGTLVKTLANAYWGANQGLWIWDGLNNDGNAVPEGFYLVKLDVFTPDGRIDTIRKTVVLTNRARK